MYFHIEIFSLRVESAKDCKSVAITTTHNLAVREDSKEEGARQRRKEMVCPQRRVIPPYGPINGGSIPPPSAKDKGNKSIKL